MIGKFSHSSDKTETLSLITPVSHLFEAHSMCNFISCDLATSFYYCIICDL